ncbi:MAG: sigma-70 family RNA polymerase sigma factor [Chloroflexi bacterium]|nr:sigma-70 family RNA polymerase sigma factor [Chloroflexota bacterium]MBU1752004.1 sigma-70 family RNA polymerase sigma factor [Chloroflexota bacterium]
MSGGERGLVQAAQAGDREAFAELVRRYQGRIYNMALRMTANPETAADLAQESFLRAYAALPRFDAAWPLAPWLFTITANLCRSWLTRRRLPTLSLDLPVTIDGEPVPREVPDERPAPDQLVEQQDLADRIRREIAGLPLEYRLVVELRHFGDLSYDEIAQTLDIPLSDVKSRLFRGRRKLRERLGDVWHT